MMLAPLRIYHFIFGLVLLAALVGGTAHAQSDKDKAFAAIEDAIRTNNADALATHFHQQVQITLKETDQAYQKGQAKFVMEQFFREAPARNFKLLHKGNMGDSFYGSGKYYTANGVYDANVFLKRRGERLVIEQLMFQRSR